LGEQVGQGPGDGEGASPGVALRRGDDAAPAQAPRDLLGDGDDAGQQVDVADAQHEVGLGL
jgi:hypothetical protein